MKFRTLATLLMVPGAIMLPVAHAGEVTGLTTFTAGTPAKAGDVNGNFTAVKTAVDDNHARITSTQSTLTDHENRITELEGVDAFGPMFYGDGSAGDLVISADTVWGISTAPDNLNFNNVTIQSGAKLTLVSGTTIRCAGTFTNAGTIDVIGLTQGGLGVIPRTDIAGLASRQAHPGDTPESPLLADFDNDGVFNIDIEPGLGGAPLYPTYVLSNLSSLHFGGSGGGGTSGASGGFGGGILRVQCNGAVTNSGVINANGTEGAGGGGGGIVMLATRTSVTHSGTITARGGNGNASTAFVGASGGGGGGIAVMIAPTVTNTGTVNVAGGEPGARTTLVNNAQWRAGGGAGGGSGGSGGNGGPVAGTNPLHPQPGDDGYVKTLQQDPLFVVR
jgi:hypothetical protein